MGLASVGAVLVAREAGPQAWVGPQISTTLVLAAGVFLSELRTIAWLRTDAGNDITATWVFAFAMVLAGAPVSAVIWIAAASLAGDLLRRTPLPFAVFNGGQLALALATGWSILRVLGIDRALIGTHPLPAWWLAGLVLAALAIYAVNAVITCVLRALLSGLPIWETVRTNAGASIGTDGLLMALAPVFVIAADRSLQLVPSLVAVTFAVYRSAQLAMVREAQAMHDQLTGLANRRRFFGHLEETLATARRTGGRTGMLAIDLDGFKLINDTLGHAAGDAALIEVARRLTLAVPSDALVARLGGDEFAIVTTSGDPAELEAMTASVHEHITQPFAIDDQPARLGASIGIAIAPEDGITADRLIEHADRSMYRAKHARRFNERRAS